VHVVVIGIDQLAARFERDAAYRDLSEHPPAGAGAAFIEMRVDPGLGQVMQRGQPGDAPADDRDPARPPRARLARIRRRPSGAP
jgi:hypothetical protein